MRAGIWVLTAALLAGCGESRQTVERYRLGSDGKPDMSTKIVEEVEVSQRGLFSTGWIYTWDCANEYQTTIYGKELKACIDGFCTSTSQPLYPVRGCRGFGMGDLAAVGFNEFLWPSGQFAGWQMNVAPVRGMACKAADYPVPPTHHSECEWYQNTNAGGGCAETTSGESACFSHIPNGEHRIRQFAEDALPQSVEFVRRCGPGSTPC